MALNSGIFVMIALLAFATLLGLANGLLKCYECKCHSIDDPGLGYANCRGDTPGALLPTHVFNTGPPFACYYLKGSGTSSNGEKYYFDVRGDLQAGVNGEPPVGQCKEEKKSDKDERYTICFCDHMDGCNEKMGPYGYGSTTAGSGVGGLGSDVNVILGFGVIALILGYLRQ